ncbi:twin-arginine translocase TatA/TatE family subunit [Cohnella phaseoli]|uniref:Sec-independent protein translocase protein TatA n=1 Tax=Cohnella phaseoli TaxID=456490 RepID=A0A3D9JMW8_9BACL|nr:twin-arginine translocase TatA/TatE family subunit [Cohnella phaseoli]RED75129.1 sec-independent protein translocase protein TatA [Cohnella phaseoli]
MSAIGVPGMILLVILALLLFGPSKLPELGKAVGRTLSEFKRGTRTILDDDSSVALAEGKAEEKANLSATHSKNG